MNTGYCLDVNTVMCVFAFLQSHTQVTFSTEKNTQECEKDILSQKQMESLEIMNVLNAFTTIAAKKSGFSQGMNDFLFF